MLKVLGYFGQNKRVGVWQDNYKITVSDDYSFDRSTKASLYARNQIKEYWIVDLINKKVIVHTQPNNNSYSQTLEYSSGTIFCQGIPDISIALNRLLLF